MQVKAKKHLGQHFLMDQQIAKKIVDSVDYESCSNVVEIGAGMGVLTQYVFEKPNLDFYIVELDNESVEYLEANFLSKRFALLNLDFLALDLAKEFPADITVLGNFPYNISSQIMFKVLENRQQVSQVVGMFQKEVAQRFAAKPGSKQYGIISVLLQAFYEVEYLFTVGPNVFNPPPKVDSGVIRFVRNSTVSLPCDEEAFFKLVKLGFNQRRKKLSNSLKPVLQDKLDHPLMDKRPEQLSVAEFVELTNLIYGQSV